MTITLDLLAVPKDAHTRRILYDISRAVVKSKRIVVVTGAGISCSCGIPDFRSSDGLYALVKQKFPDVVLKGRDLFDASLFRDPTSTAVFYTFISELKRSIDCAFPTLTHQFIKTLDTKKRLLRSYTQNIDGLEERAGLLGTSCEDAQANEKGKRKLMIKGVRNVQLHGDIHRVRCVSCSAEYPCTAEHLKMFGLGTAPDCPECLTRSEARVARSARAIKVGTLRPAIVLYDEPHPLGDEIGSIQAADVGRKPDLLIIMGTSLKVHGLKKLVKDFARTIQENSKNTTLTSKPKPKVIFVNKTSPSSEWADIIDYHITGETDVWVAKVIEDWKQIRSADWETQQTLDGNSTIASPFKAMKLGTEATKAKKSTSKKAQDENRSSSGPLMGSHVPPLSPSKRQKGTSHYNDLESSPTKRQSVSASKTPPKHALAPSERKFLFGESTNHANSGLEDTPMDISLVDLSMRDIGVAAEKTVNGIAPVARKASTDRTRTQTKKSTATAKRRATQKRVVEVVIP